MQIVRTKEAMKEAMEQRLVDKAAAALKHNMPIENAPLPKKKAKLPAAAAVPTYEQGQAASSSSRSSSGYGNGGPMSDNTILRSLQEVVKS